MKQIEEKYICYTCFGCNRLELEEFKGIYRCVNYIKKERAKENAIKEDDKYNNK